MTIVEAKEQINRTIRIYLDRDEYGAYRIPYMKQRPMFMIGAPGIGKTAIVEQLAAELEIGLVCYSMTHHTRQSAIGLPFIAQKIYGGEEVRASEYTMSEIIASVYDKVEEGYTNGILFLDEINCVSETLAPAILQFLQYKSFGNRTLPKGWVIVSAGNPPQYYKSVRDFDIATRDRLKYIYVEEDFPTWKAYAYARGVHGAIIAFLEVNKAWFYSIQTTVEGPSFATARGWEDLSYAIGSYEKFGLPVDLSLIIQYITASDIARRFAVFYELYKKYQMDYHVQDVLDGKWDEALLERTKDAAFDERISLVELLQESLTKEIAALLEKQEMLESVAEKLRTLKPAAEDPAALNDGGASLRDAMEQMIWNLDQSLHRSAGDGIYDRKSVLCRMERKTLQELLDLIAKDKEEKTAFDHVRKAFSTRAKKQAREVDDAKERLENAFRFLEESFGNGQELVYFMTVLTANIHTLSFIARFGSDAYQRHNSTLLLYDIKEQLKDEIRSNLQI